MKWTIELFDAVFAYLRGFFMLFSHGLGKHIIKIGLISLVVAFVCIGGILWYLISVLGHIFEGGIWNGVWEMSTVLFLAVLAFSLYKNLVLIIAGSTLGKLSEEVEEILTGKEIETIGFRDSMQDMVRGIWIGLRATLRELAITLPLLLLNFIPVLGSIIATVLIFMVQAYYAGTGNIDLLLERKRYNIKDRVAFARNHRGLMLGNGAAFLAISLLIPVVGFILAPSMGIIAATRVGVKYTS